MTTAKVRFGGGLRHLVPGGAPVEAQGETVGEVLGVVAARHPSIMLHFLDPEGELKPDVDVFVRDGNIRFHGGLDTPTVDGGLITLIPAR